MTELLYHKPTLDEAREWAWKFPGQPISSFACKYPGRYREAATLARQATRKEEDRDVHTE